MTRLFHHAGYVVLVAAIAPFRAGRDFARALFEPGQFVEVHVETPLEVAEGRDPNGLYRKARSGQLSNVTGIDSPHEAPLDPEVRVDTMTSPEEAADQILDTLVHLGLVDVLNSE